MKNTFFGKGLESLIPNKSAKDREKPKEKKEPVFLIEIEKIKPNPYQPRKEFDLEGLRTLAESIRDFGILQPLVATKIEKKTLAGSRVEYQLITGERRLLAAKMAGLTQVPIIIRQPSEREKLEISLIENVQRLDLNPMEKAQAYQRLGEEFNFSQEEIGRLCGKSRVAVANTLRLLELPPEIKQGLRERKVSEGHARAILQAKGSQNQKNLFAKILKRGMSVREAEDFAQKLKVWKPAPTKISPHLHQEMKKWERRFKQLFKLKEIRVGMVAGKPKLTLIFNSKQEIENLLKKIRLS